MTTETIASPLKLLSQDEAAASLRISRRTLQRLRASEAGGPPFVRIGERRICYRASDLDTWLAAQQEARS